MIHISIIPDSQIRYWGADSPLPICYTSVYTGDYNELLYLRTRYYAPNEGRFLTKDTWSGDANLPLSYNKWAYANANPVMYTDPSGHCIFGIDTAFCIAVLVGVPLIAGVTTSSWDYYVTQAHGVGGANEFNPSCVDWGQVFGAGRAGSLGAVESFVTLPFGVPYLVLNYGYGISPTQANTAWLSYVGLDDEYLLAHSDPYYISGNAGGSVGALDLSLHSLLIGLPGLSSGPGIQFGATNTMALSGTNVTAMGGDLSLIYTGTSGLISSSMMMSGNNGGSSGQWHHVLSNKIFRELSKHPTLKGKFNREDFLVQASSELDHRGYQTWHREYDSEVTNWLRNNPYSSREEFIFYLRSIYQEPQLKQQFPSALDIIK